MCMGNSTSSSVNDKGDVELKFTSMKFVFLQQVLYVSDIRKNFILGSLLIKHRLKIVFESDKVVLTKNGVFLGKGIAIYSKFKLNTINEM